MLSQDSSDNESLKLFSQDTYLQLCAQLGVEDLKPVIDDPGLFMQEGDLVPRSQENIDQQQSVVLLPTLTEFAGEYGFNIEFGKQPRLAKSTVWCYSPDLNRLYVQLHKHCQLAFVLTTWSHVAAADGRGTAERGGTRGSQELFVRAMPVFTNNLQVPVERCPYHVIDDAALGHCHHFVWADHPSAAYFTDDSQRRTTMVPFQIENDLGRKTDGVNEPSSSGRSVWYDYSFKCRSTCVGSLNRRPVSIIFTLESSDGTVLGRRVIEVKVCTCPGRDMLRDRGSNTGSSFSVPCPYTRPINFPSRMNEPSKQSRWRQSGSDSATTVRSRSSQNPSKKLAVRAQVPPTRCVPSTTIVSSDKSLPAFGLSVSSHGNIAKTEPANVMQKHAAGNVVYCVQVRNKKHYKTLMAVSRLMTSNVNPEAVVAACMKRDLNAASTDSVQSDSDSKCSSGVNSLLHSSQVSGRSTSSAQDKAGGVEHSFKGVRLSIQEWLDSLGLVAYTDDFARAGYRTMTDLQDGRRFSMMDLRKLQIGVAHTAVIWKSLKQWRLQV